MCEIVSGYDKLCDTVGGVATVPMANKADIESYTVLNGSVTALTMKAGKYIYPFNVEMETANFQEQDIGERANGASAVQQTGTVVLHGNDADLVVKRQLLRRGRVVAFPELNDGTYEAYFLGNGGKVTGLRTTGTAYEDLNGTTLTITGKEKDNAPKISAVLIAANLAPAS